MRRWLPYALFLLSGCGTWISPEMVGILEQRHEFDYAVLVERDALSYEQVRALWESRVEEDRLILCSLGVEPPEGCDDE